MDASWLGLEIEVWQTIITAVAVLAAGVWAVFLQLHLRQRAKATAEISKIIKDTEKAEAEIKELELKARAQVSVSARIDANTIPDGKYGLLIITVSIANHGNEATRIKWSGEPPAFTVRFVTFDGDGKPQHGPSRDFPITSTRDPSVPARSHVIRAGTTEDLTFAFRPDRAGLYLLSFRGAVDEDVRNDAQRFGIQLPTAWTARRYVYIDKGSYAGQRPA